MNGIQGWFKGQLLNAFRQRNWSLFALLAIISLLLPIVFMVGKVKVEGWETATFDKKVPKMGDGVAMAYEWPLSLII